MNYVYIAASVDGYIASKNGGVDWLQELPNPDHDDYGYSAFMENIDALVMGRNTFEKVLTFGDWSYKKKVFVLSSTLSEVPDELRGKVEMVSGSLVNVLQYIHSLGFESLYIDGGKVIQSFLAEDLIDELIITRIPIILGEGIPLFGRLIQPIRFVHMDTTVYDNALVKSHYARKYVEE
jgi:dihydrofolate reductase